MFYVWFCMFYVWLHLFYVLLYIYLGSIAISFACSLVSFKYRYPVHLKIFALFLGSSFLVEFTANILFPVWHLNKYRNALYNSFALFEFVFYAYFFYLITHIKWIRKIHIGFMLVYPLLWIKMVFNKDGFYQWHGDQTAVGGFFVVCFALLYIYHLYDSEELKDLSNHTEFWISIGLILFYCCQTPFLGTLKYLSHHYLVMTKMLLKVSLIINSLMYCLFTYAFLCRRRKYS